MTLLFCAAMAAAQAPPKYELFGALGIEEFREESRPTSHDRMTGSR
jgi:hypothetical protein